MVSSIALQLKAYPDALWKRLEGVTRFVGPNGVALFCNERLELISAAQRQLQKERENLAHGSEVAPGSRLSSIVAGCFTDGIFTGLSIVSPKELPKSLQGADLGAAFEHLADLDRSVNAKSGALKSDYESLKAAALPLFKYHEKQMSQSDPL